jgi:serine/threonine protein kinase/ketosteroid isomerase-like protein
MIDALSHLAAALEDHYRIESEIGSGGMATVYRARDIKHDREVALKVLRPELASILGADRFLNEIAIAARLDHPHILTLIDSGAARGSLYYVLPFVRGESLRTRLRRDGPLAIDDAIGITKDIGSALEYAHRHGVVHRDVKPENILIHEGEAVLADFGIALAVKEAGGARLTQSGLSLGTPQYMSPEQAMGDRSVDARSDQYSLAAVLYEMLVGEPPHSGPNLQAIIAKLLTQRPVRIRTLRETVPISIESAVEKGLAKLPADRYPTVDGFVKAISTLTPAQSGEFHRRSWTRVAAACAVGAVIVVAIYTAAKSATSSGTSQLSRGEQAAGGVQNRPNAVDSLRNRRGSSVRDDLAEADSVRRTALNARMTAMKDGATARALAGGDTQLDEAEALLRNGRVTDGIERLESARVAWINADPEHSNTGAQIERLIRDYERAIEWQDPKRMAAAFPVLTQKQRAAWAQFFAMARAVRAQLEITKMDVAGDTAYADVRGTYTYTMRTDGKTYRMPASFSTTLTRAGGVWRMSSVK